MSVPLAVEGMDAMALAQLGERLCRENNFNSGIVYLQKALEKKIDLGARSIEAVSAIYSQLGNAYFALRNFDKALEYHGYDLETAKLLGDQVGIAKAYGNIGNTFKALGDFDNAYEHAVAHLRIAREIKDQESEARALYNLGSVFHCRAKASLHSSPFLDQTTLTRAKDRNVNKQLRAAIDYYLQNLVIVESMNDTAACGRAYGNLGNSYYMLGDYATAVDYHKKRLEVARQFGDRTAMKRAYTNLGNTHIFLSEPAKALEYYRLAYSLAVELHDEISEAQCCLNIGNGAAISGDHNTAVEFHTRYLKLSRNLRDRAGESRACAALAADFRTRGEPHKAAYFLILCAEVALKLHDIPGEMNARSSLEELLRSEGKWPLTDGQTVNDIEVDPSADPEPRSVAEISASLHSLLFDDERSEGGLSRRPVGTSSSSLTDELQHRPSVNIDDDFFEMLSRMQSKRINDQRCDPVILSDLTNRTKGFARQSDTIACNAGNTTQTSRGSRKSRRLSSIFGRVRNGITSFRPVSTSTPRPRPASAVLNTDQAYISVTGPNFDQTFSTVSEEDLANRSKISLLTSTTYVASTSPVFRVPIAPPRNRRAARTSSSTSLNSLRAISEPLLAKQGAEGMLDLIASLQGRRMEEQRAHLNVTQEIVSVGDDAAKDDEDNGRRERVERSRSEDAGSLYEMLIRSQSDRLEEQRSELPGTDEDISQIVMTMQKGRINAQRAHLYPPNQD